MCCNAYYCCCFGSGQCQHQLATWAYGYLPLSLEWCHFTERKIREMRHWSGVRFLLRIRNRSTSSLGIRFDFAALYRCFFSSKFQRKKNKWYFYQFSGTNQSKGMKLKERENSPDHQNNDRITIEAVRILRFFLWASFCSLISWSSFRSCFSKG